MTLPLLASYEQKHYVERTAHPVRDSFGRLARVFSEIPENAGDLVLPPCVLLLY